MVGGSAHEKDDADSSDLTEDSGGGGSDSGSIKVKDKIKLSEERGGTRSVDAERSSNSGSTSSSGDVEDERKEEGDKGDVDGSSAPSETSDSVKPPASPSKLGETEGVPEEVEEAKVEGAEGGDGQRNEQKVETNEEEAGTESSSHGDDAGKIEEDKNDSGATGAPAKAPANASEVVEDLPMRRSKRARKESAVMREISMAARGSSTASGGIGVRTSAEADSRKMRKSMEAKSGVEASEAGVKPKGDEKTKPDAEDEPEAEAKAPPEAQPAETAKGGSGGGRAKRTRAPPAFYAPAPPSSSSGPGGGVGVEGGSAFSHSVLTSPFATPIRSGSTSSSSAVAVATRGIGGSVETGTSSSGDANEMSAKERREWRRAQAAERARELRVRGRKLSPVSRPLGFDREGNVYLVFRGDPGAVYVGAHNSAAVTGGGSVKEAVNGRGEGTGNDIEKKDGEGGEKKKPAWSVFRGEAVEELVSDSCKANIVYFTHLFTSVRIHA